MHERSSSSPARSMQRPTMVRGSACPSVARSSNAIADACAQQPTPAPAPRFRSPSRGHPTPTSGPAWDPISSAAETAETPSRSLVCVVHDDVSVPESLPDLLRELGFEAEAFASAEEFLASESLEQAQCLLL